MKCHSTPSKTCHQRGNCERSVTVRDLPALPTSDLPSPANTLVSGRQENDLTQPSPNTGTQSRSDLPGEPGGTKTTSSFRSFIYFSDHCQVLSSSPVQLSVVPNLNIHIIIYTTFDTLLYNVAALPEILFCMNAQFHHELI